MRKCSLFLAVILMLILAGCTGIDGQIKEIDQSASFASVYLNNSANWDDKTTEEKMELAQYAVDKCLDNDEIKSVYGHFGEYPRRTVFYYDATDFPKVSIDEDEITEYLKERNERLMGLFSDTIPHVDSTELFGVENKVAYYNVYIVSSANWDWNTTNEQDRKDLVEAAIKVCARKYSGDGADLYEVMGYTEDGHVAFSWRGGSTVKVYIGGIHDHDYIR